MSSRLQPICGIFRPCPAGSESARGKIFPGRGQGPPCFAVFKAFFKQKLHAKEMPFRNLPRSARAPGLGQPFSRQIRGGVPNAPTAGEDEPFGQAKLVGVGTGFSHLSAPTKAREADREKRFRRVIDDPILKTGSFTGFLQRRLWENRRFCVEGNEKPAFGAACWDDSRENGAGGRGKSAGQADAFLRETEGARRGGEGGLRGIRARPAVIRGKAERILRILR